MANLVEFLNLKTKPYLKIFTILFFVLLFAGLSYYFYKQVYMKKYSSDSNAQKYNDIANKNERQSDVTIYFITVPWCPYCKKALADWDQFKNEYNGKTMQNGSRVSCIRVDEKDPNENSNQFENIKNVYKVEKFPTVFILYEEKKYDFDSSVTYYALTQFVETVTNN